MPYTIEPLNKKQKIPSFHKLLVPIDNIINHVPILQSTCPTTSFRREGNRSLQMNFEQQLKALIFYHLEEHSSGRHLLEVLEKDDFAKTNIAPPDGIKTCPNRYRRESSFFEAINHRGLEQLLYIFQRLQADAAPPELFGQVKYCQNNMKPLEISFLLADH